MRLKTLCRPLSQVRSIVSSIQAQAVVPLGLLFFFLALQARALITPRPPMANLLPFNAVAEWIGHVLWQHLHFSSRRAQAWCNADSCTKGC